jgi:hypothetical protein
MITNQMQYRAAASIASRFQAALQNLEAGYTPTKRRALELAAVRAMLGDLQAELVERGPPATTNTKGPARSATSTSSSSANPTATPSTKPPPGLLPDSTGRSRSPSASLAGSPPGQEPSMTPSPAVRSWPCPLSDKASVKIQPSRLEELRGR